MERFDIRGSDWGLQHRTDGLGAFCWAEEVRNYQGAFNVAFIFNIIISIICAVLAAYIVFHKHDPVPVQKVSEEEYQRTIQEQRRLKTELSATQKRMADLKAETAQFKKMLQTSNANNAKLVQQLKEVQASVPPLPIIQEALRQEAATPQGFRQAVDRAFGNGMGARIKVVNE